MPGRCSSDDDDARCQIRPCGATSLNAVAADERHHGYTPPQPPSSGCPLAGVDGWSQVLAQRVRVDAYRPGRRA